MKAKSEATRSSNAFFRNTKSRLLVIFWRHPNGGKCGDDRSVATNFWNFEQTRRRAPA